jgi:hypothetical protein
MWSAIGISAYFYVSDAVRFAQGFFVSEIWGQPISSYLFLYYCFYHLRFSERRRVMKTKSNIKKTWLGTLFVVGSGSHVRNRFCGRCRSGRAHK